MEKQIFTRAEPNVSRRSNVDYKQDFGVDGIMGFYVRKSVYKGLGFYSE